MAYLNPRYNGRVGVYRTNEIERFGTAPVVPANVFTAGPLGGMIFIPINKGLTAAPASSANSARYTYPLVETYTDQRSSIDYASSVATRDVGLAIDGVNYDIFDFAVSNSTIDMSSWQASGVYKYVNENTLDTFKVISSGQFFTFSGIQLKTAINISPASGRQVISFNIYGSASFTFAPYSSSFGGYINQVKVYFYNYTSSESLTYAGSYSTAGLIFTNYQGTLLI